MYPMTPANADRGRHEGSPQPTYRRLTACNQQRVRSGASAEDWMTAGNRPAPVFTGWPAHAGQTGKQQTS